MWNFRDLHVCPVKICERCMSSEITKLRSVPGAQWTDVVWTQQTTLSSSSSAHRNSGMSHRISGMSEWIWNRAETLKNWAQPHCCGKNLERIWHGHFPFSGFSGFSGSLTCEFFVRAFRLIAQPSRALMSEQTSARRRGGKRAESVRTWNGFDL